MNKIYDMTEDDLAKELVGKQIAAIDDEAGTITLSDGTLLELEDSSDCCAYFDGVLKTIDLTENAITAVEYTDRAQDKYDERWTLTILSVDKAVAAIEIDGSSGSGYYCHSINLKVTRVDVTS